MLSDEQARVVASNAEKIVCVAGAGCGKTYTLMRRIERLISDGVSPDSMLVFTYTRAAAFELNRRYLSIIGEYIHVDGDSTWNSSPYFGTFHSFCYDVIKDNPEFRTELGYSEVPSVITDTEYKTLCRQVSAQLNIKPSRAKTPFENRQQQILQKSIIQRMKQGNVITFDLMVEYVLDKLSLKDSLFQKYSNQYKYIFVDEFQDTDDRQYRFIQMFSDANLYVTGDVMQCHLPGAKVRRKDGTYTDIKDIEIGDEVLGVNTFGTVTVNTVTNIHSSESNVVKLYCRDTITSYSLDHLTYAKLSKTLTYVVGVYAYGNSVMDNGANNLSFFFAPNYVFDIATGTTDFISTYIYDNTKNVTGVWLLNSYEDMEAAKENYRSDVKYYEMRRDEMSNEEILRDILKLYGVLIYSSVPRLYSENMYILPACNLLPGVFDLVHVDTADIDNPIETSTSEIDVRSVSYETKTVYGISVSPTHNYIIDGYLTHNCIYQFMGANPEILQNIINDPSWQVFSISYNHRSTQEICEYANSIAADVVGHVDITSFAHGSPVDEHHDIIDPAYEEYEWCRELIESHLSEKLRRPGTHAILLRTNREASMVSHLLMEYTDIPICVKSPMDQAYDLFMSAVSMEYRMMYLPNLLTMDDYLIYERTCNLEHAHTVSERYIVYYRMFYNNYKIQNNIDTIIQLESRIANEFNSTVSNRTHEDLIPYLLHELTVYIKLSNGQFNALKYAESLQEFSDVFAKILMEHTYDVDHEVYVGTIHSVKGLEYDYVYVLNVGGHSFHVGQSDYKNVLYVAATRAKRGLEVRYDG